MRNLIIMLVILWIASVILSFHIWQKTKLPHNSPQNQIVNIEPVNWVATRRIVRNIYKTSISLEPNLSPVDTVKIAEYFVKQRCKQAEIRRITILYTSKTNVWVIWREK